MTDDNGFLLARLQLWQTKIVQAITTAMKMDSTASAPPGCSDAIEKFLSAQRHAYRLCQQQPEGINRGNVDIGQLLDSNNWNTNDLVRAACKEAEAATARLSETQ